MTQSINKSEFTYNVATSCEYINDALVEDAVREIIGLMVDEIANGNRIEVRGFGSFSLHHRLARNGRNPKTGEKVAIPAKAIPHFKPGKALREAVIAQMQSEI